MLKKMRVGVSLAVFVLLTLYLLDFASLWPESFSWLAKIQFIPALLALNFIVVAALLVATLFWGRIYCSSVCPMGVFQDVASRLGRWHRGKKKSKFKYAPAKNRWRYSILAASVIAFILGFAALMSLLDPYSAFARMVVDVFRPLYVAGNNMLARVFDYMFYREAVLVRSVTAFAVGLLTFILIGVWGWLRGRGYCNTVCPVGTILGFVSRFSFFKVRIDTAKCNNCGLCATKCKASCIDSKNHAIDYSRCVDCFNCLGACKTKALSFTMAKPGDKKVAATKKADRGDASDIGLQDEGRRKFMLTSLAVGAALPALLAEEKDALLSQGKAYKRKTVISPPGSKGHWHLGAHCTACHLCVSRCPSKVIVPSLTEYGLGGLMQPVMNFEQGFCNYDCTVCGEVCPNAAIEPLSKEEKHLTQIGRVVFIEQNCIVHTDGTSCGACAEHCPTQAVTMVPYRDGLTIPLIDPEICVGCGGCEYICPVRPYRAIHVEGNAEHIQAKPIATGQKQDVEIDGFGF